MHSKILDLWEIPEVNTGTRSRLYRLSPRGHGTPLQEAMTSYLVRLAHAHTVSPLALITHEILPLTKIRLKKSSGSFTAIHAKTINSYVKYAREFCEVVGRLTARNDLAQASFLPWADVFDPKGTGIVHERPRWCSHCLSDWRMSGEEGYFPLLWYAHSVKICPTHGQPLKETCPECGKHQPFIPKHYHIDHCSHCGTWLGHQPSVTRGDGHELTEFDEFCARAIAEMIGESSKAPSYASHARFREQLGTYPKVLTNGVFSEFERRVGLRKGILKEWRGKNARPEIKQLLMLSFRLATTPVQFLREEVPAKLSPVAARFPVHYSKSRKRLSIKRANELQAALQAMIESDDEPLPLKNTCEKLGYARGFFLYRYPNECSAIVEKWKRFVKERAVKKKKKDSSLAYQLTTNFLREGHKYNGKTIEALLRPHKLFLVNPITRDAVRRARTDFYSGATTDDVDT